MVTLEYKENLKNKMTNRNVEDLVKYFNMQVDNPGWSSIRGIYDYALIESLIAKGVDVSAVYDGCNISFTHKIRLNKEQTKIEII
jgi:hypothetical protein